MAGISAEEMLTAVLASEGLLELVRSLRRGVGLDSAACQAPILVRLLAEGYGEPNQAKLDNRFYMARILNDLASRGRLYPHKRASICGQPAVAVRGDQYSVTASRFVWTAVVVGWSGPSTRTQSAATDCSREIARLRSPAAA